MQIIMNTGGIASTNSYLVADEATKQAVIFDAPDGTVTPLLDEAAKRGYDVIGLWLTHGHFDHVADHAVVTERFPKAKVLIHPLDEPKIQKPMSSVFSLPFVIPARSADERLSDGQRLSIGELEVEVIHTPGHSPGHVMFHFPKEKLLIGGDLIIMGAVGRTDLPDADYGTLQESIRRVMKLPDETRLLGGHGDPSSLGDERRGNLYIKEALEGR
jgi:glyoxylase-like metal-dependent hydrolase (beta-lactamase superfamily II)